MTTHTDMKYVLDKLDLEHLISAFEREKITPDIVCKLSLHEMHFLGITNAADVMKLRTECIKYGSVACQLTGHLDKREFEISKALLQTLIESGFMISEISKLLSVSESTVYRRMRMFDLTVLEFTRIDISSLKEKMKVILSEYPRCGECMMRHIWKEHGIKVCRPIQDISRLNKSIA